MALSKKTISGSTCYCYALGQEKKMKKFISSKHHLRVDISALVHSQFHNIRDTLKIIFGNICYH